MEKLPFIHFRETNLSKKEKKFLDGLYRGMIDFPDNSAHIQVKQKFAGRTFRGKELVVKVVFVKNFTKTTDKIVLEPGYLTLSSEDDIKKLEKFRYTANCHGILSGFYESKKKVYIVIELTVDEKNSHEELIPLRKKIKFPREYRIRFFNPFLDFE